MERIHIVMHLQIYILGYNISKPFNPIFALLSSPSLLFYMSE